MILLLVKFDFLYDNTKKLCYNKSFITSRNILDGIFLFIKAHDKDAVHDLGIGHDIFEQKQSSLKSVVDGNIDEDSFKLEKLDDLML
jgi:hypothetical protein